MIVPDKCFALNNMTISPKTKAGEVIEVRAFEAGYYTTTLRLTQEEVNEMNETIGVSVPQSKAMQVASMFGWQVYKGCLDRYEELERSHNERDNQNETY